MKCSAILSNVYVFDVNPLTKDALKNHINLSDSLTVYSDYIKEVLTRNKKCHVLEDVINETIEAVSKVTLEKIEYYLFPFFSKGTKTKYMLIAASHIAIETSGFSELNNMLFSYSKSQETKNKFENKMVACIQASKHFRSNVDWSSSLRNIGRFKLYVFVEAEKQQTEEERFCVLSDFCSAMPSGTTAYSLGLQKEVKNPDHAYASSYLNTLKENNFSTVYKNWSMLTLLDACMFLHDPYEKTARYDKKNNFTDDYFKMYVLNVFNYFFLEEINNYSRAKNYSENHLFKVFLNYNKYYNLDSVSTKFLPNLINNVMKKGMELEDKYESTKSKIMQEKDYAIEKSSELTSKVLLLIAILSLSSFLADTTQWVEIFRDELAGGEYSIVSYLACGILFTFIMLLIYFLGKHVVIKKMLK